MSAIKRVAYVLDQNYTPGSGSWIDVGDTADERLYIKDLRAVLCLAKQAAALKRRVRLARAECRPFGSIDRISDILTKPLRAGARAARKGRR